MTNTTPHTPPAQPIDPLHSVVVGVDGSENSLATLDWAGRMVAPGGQVHVVIAVATRLGLSPVEEGTPTVIDDLQGRLDGAWGTAARDTGALLTGHIVDLSPADALMHVAVEQHADAIVVGAHDGEQRALRLIGRTISRLLRRSPVPLVIVPEHASAVADRNTVVIGVGDSDASASAVRWAARFVDARQSRVAVVKAVSARPTVSSEGLFVLLAHLLDPSVLHDWARDDADQLAADLQRLTVTDTEITTSVVDGSAGARLVEAGQEAALLIVGRGRPTTVHHTIAHAPCPVVVIAGDHDEPDDRDDTDDD